MSGISIRKASPADAAGIAHVQVAGWRFAYHGIMDADYLANLDEEEKTFQWEKRLSSDQAAAWIAIQDDHVVGFCRAGPLRKTKALEEAALDFSTTGELYAIYVLEEFQRQGLGQHFLRQVKLFFNKEDYTQFIVWALSENKRALKFYQNQGGVFLLEEDHPIAGNTYPESCLVFRDLNLEE